MRSVTGVRMSRTCKEMRHARAVARVGEDTARPGQADIHLGASFAEARRALQAALEDPQGGGIPIHPHDGGKKTAG